MTFPPWGGHEQRAGGVAGRDHVPDGVSEKLPNPLTKVPRLRMTSHAIRVACPPEGVFRPVERIGGDTGWYFGGVLWKLRGWLDLLVGGIGLRRGRRDPEHLAPGDTVDFWRVQEIEPPRRLVLLAEMKLPGRGWLVFETEADGEGHSWLRQTAVFDPRGLAGIAYWKALLPVHGLIFRGMLRRLRDAAERPALDLGRPG